MHEFTPEDNAALGHFVRRFTLPKRRGSAFGPETGQSLNYARAVRIPEETDAAVMLRATLATYKKTTRGIARRFAAESDSLDFFRLREHMAIARDVGPDAVGIAHEARTRVNWAHRHDYTNRPWTVY